MKKTILVLFASISIISCDYFKKEEEVKPEPVDAAKDVVLGGDKDDNGCLASAGYTWSKLNKDCVRVFSGLQLSPANDPSSDDATLCTYVLFDEKADNAELFLPNQDESIVLTRKAEGQPYVNGEWQLIPWKGFVLKKSGEIVYSGDGEIGNKVSGSLDSEEIPITE